jgi:hypothetical protein
MNKPEFIASLLMLGFQDHGTSFGGEHDFDLYDPLGYGRIVVFVRFLGNLYTVKAKQNYDRHSRDMLTLWQGEGDPIVVDYQEPLQLIVSYLEKYREVNRD